MHVCVLGKLLIIIVTKSCIYRDCNEMRACMGASTAQIVWRICVGFRIDTMQNRKGKIKIGKISHSCVLPFVYMALLVAVPRQF